MSLHLHLRNRAEWGGSGASLARGHVFTPEGRQLGPSDLAARTAMASTPEALSAMLTRLNGFFALVHQGDGWLVAAVDPVRSLPLFYGQRAEALYLSDDAEWVRSALGEIAYAPVARLEFSLAGFVTGHDTLYPGVKQLQAGEALWVTWGASLEVQHRRYRPISATPRLPGLPDADPEALDAVLVACFNRLADRAAGRPIAVPLSGGLNSRLVALMLKRVGYDRILTFSYGTDRPLGEQEAHDMGLPWRGVPIEEAVWRRWFHDPARERYYAMADGLSVLPRLAPWVAVAELVAERALPADSVVVPGLSADLLAGRHSQAFPELYRQPAWKPDQVAEDILRAHFILSDWRANRAHLTSRLVPRVIETLDRLGPFADGASAFEAWDWHERQAKSVVNVVRAYEFWGLDWWLPFWDQAYIDFWERVPRHQRAGERLYQTYVRAQYRHVSGGAGERLPWQAADRMRAPLQRALQALGVPAWLTSVNRLPDAAVLGVLSGPKLRKLPLDREPGEAFLALERIGEIAFDAF